MFLGTTIDDLTALVQRAEAHADDAHDERSLPGWLADATPQPRSINLQQLVRTFGVGAA